MRVPLNWLREYCDPPLDTAAIEERLTMTGTKVEAIHHHGVGALEHFVVARVTERSPHPDADRLSVCTVDHGDDAPATVVCGAPNVAAGQTVAFARPGAVMPDGTRLKAAKLRGVRSEGMILAEDEVALGTDHAGIMVLDDAHAPGTPLIEVLPIATDVLELEITPNRPDCLAVYGVARELHAATGAPLAPAPWLQEDPGSDGPLDGVSIDVDCPDLCPRFAVRLLEGVRLGPSPLWLKARLLAAGMRPINNVVDVTNYVMLLCGQPLHAFDFDRVAGGSLRIRRADDGELIDTLDGSTRSLDGEMVVIEDADGPTSIAGVMGGARSEVSESTTRVLLESATWNGPNIHRTSARLGLRSEASARFEKGLAPEQAAWAMTVATRLLVEVCGATVLPGTIDVLVAGATDAPASLRLRAARVREVLGTDVAPQRQAEILQALNFGVALRDGELDVDVPPERRNDVTREADLIEEIARIDGLDKLPATLPARRGGGARLSRDLRLRRRALDALVGCGACEVVGWTFTSPAALERLRLGAHDAVALINPLSGDHSLLRTTLLTSLLEIAQTNVARGNRDLCLVECGTTFAPSGEQLPRETRSLGVLVCGNVTPADWAAGAPRQADFFAGKALLDALADALRAPVAVEPARRPFLHPGRAARVLAGGREIGYLGELHPELELPDGTTVMEIALDELIAAVPQALRYEDVIGFPALHQDLAVALDEAVPAAAVLATVREAAGPLLRDVTVFDVYSGPQVGEGRRSLALALSFRSGERTLTDEDVAPLRTRIVTALEQRHGGQLRA